MTSEEAVRVIVRGNGYYDEAEVLWALLMVCDRCSRRAIDCTCRAFEGSSADGRLMAVGRELKAQASDSPEKP